MYGHLQQIHLQRPTLCGPRSLVTKYDTCSKNRTKFFCEICCTTQVQLQLIYQYKKIFYILSKFYKIIHTYNLFSQNNWLSCKWVYCCTWSISLQMVQLQVVFFAANGRCKWFCCKCHIFAASVLFCCKRPAEIDLLQAIQLQLAKKKLQVAKKKLQVAYGYTIYVFYQALK